MHRQFNIQQDKRLVGGFMELTIQNSSFSGVKTVERMDDNKKEGLRFYIL